MIVNAGEEKTIYPYKNYWPQIEDTAFVAPGARIIGQVFIGAYSSLWYNVVARGDIDAIKIGKYTNIQDNSTIHVAYDFHAAIGDYVTVGHNAIIHGCEIDDHCLIGMGAIILNYAHIGKNSIIAAGSLIPQGRKIPPNSLVMGSPGKIIREVTDEEIKNIRLSADKYAEIAQEYLRGF
jgi:carbonic anhydrase/acetyltransferase-like protein (isoleucine patch superfamily)